MVSRPCHNREGGGRRCHGQPGRGEEASSRQRKVSWNGHWFFLSRARVGCLAARRALKGLPLVPTLGKSKRGANVRRVSTRVRIGSAGPETPKKAEAGGTQVV